jgi:glycosyltransferase involved in cell wall biosynthesis
MGGDIVAKSSAGPLVAISPAQSPKVTVGITIYSADRLPYLREAIASAQEQTYENFEIVISDDGTSSDVYRFCSTLSEIDRRVRYFRNASRQGIAGNWNSILEKADGEYVLIIGDDDRLLPRCLEWLMSTGGRHDVLFGNHFVIDDAGKRVGGEDFTEKYGRAALSDGPLTEPLEIISRNGIPICAALIKLSTARAYLFDRKLNTPEQEFFFRLAVAGATFAFTPAYVSEYRTHQLSETVAGLWIDRHVAAMLRVEVPIARRHWKRIMIHQYIIAAVLMAIANNEPKLARRFVWSGYLPFRRRLFSSVAAALAAHLPKGLAQRIPYIKRRRLSRPV